MPADSSKSSSVPRKDYQEYYIENWFGYPQWMSSFFTVPGWPRNPPGSSSPTHPPPPTPPAAAPAAADEGAKPAAAAPSASPPPSSSTVARAENKAFPNLNSEKDYAIGDLLNRLMSLGGAVLTGELPDTILNQPRDVATYDPLAATRSYIFEKKLDDFSELMIKPDLARNAGVLLDQLGIPTNNNNPSAWNSPANIVKFFHSISPDLTENILGLSGIHQAAQAFTVNGSGLAIGRGITPAGVLHQAEYLAHTEYATALGAQAFKNYIKDGEVDVQFTKGLSLGQTAWITNAMLADQSHYKDWAQQQAEKRRTAIITQDGLEIAGDPSRRDELYTTREKRTSEYSNAKEKIVDEETARKLQTGLGYTVEALKSFGDHIGKTQREFNSLVAATAKLTGSVPSAIEYLQKSTGGKAFSAGEEADALRKKVLDTVITTRLAAADANIGASEMHAMIFDPYQGFQTIFDQSRAGSPLGRLFGHSPTTAHLGTIAGELYATWARDNPNATIEDRERARVSLQQNIASFAKGDAMKLNAIATLAESSGLITKKEVDGYVERGDANALYLKLGEVFGGTDHVDALFENAGALALVEGQNGARVRELNEKSFKQGRVNDVRTTARQRTLESAKALAEAALSPKIKDPDRNIKDELDTLHQEAMLSDDALKVAGLKSEQIDALRKKKPSSVAAIREAVGEAGGNIAVLDWAAWGIFGEKATEKYKGENQGADIINARIKSPYSSAYEGLTYSESGSVSEKFKVLQGKAAHRVRREELARLRARLLSEDPKEREEALGDVKNIVLKNLGPENKYNFSQSRHLTAALEVEVSKLKNLGDGDKANKARKVIYAKAATATIDAITSGKSEREALTAGYKVLNSGKVETEGDPIEFPGAGLKTPDDGVVENLRATYLERFQALEIANTVIDKFGGGSEFKKAFIPSLAAALYDVQKDDKLKEAPAEEKIARALTAALEVTPGSETNPAHKKLGELAALFAAPESPEVKTHMERATSKFIETEVKSTYASPKDGEVDNYTYWQAITDSPVAFSWGSGDPTFDAMLYTDARTGTTAAATPAEIKLAATIVQERDSLAAEAVNRSLFTRRYRPAPEQVEARKSWANYFSSLEKTLTGYTSDKATNGKPQNKSWGVTLPFGNVESIGELRAANPGAQVVPKVNVTTNETIGHSINGKEVDPESFAKSSVLEVWDSEGTAQELSLSELSKGLTAVLRQDTDGTKFREFFIGSWTNVLDQGKAKFQGLPTITGDETLEPELKKNLAPIINDVFGFEKDSKAPDFVSQVWKEFADTESQELHARASAFTQVVNNLSSSSGNVGQAINAERSAMFGDVSVFEDLRAVLQELARVLQEKKKTPAPPPATS